MTLNLHLRLAQNNLMIRYSFEYIRSRGVTETIELLKLSSFALDFHLSKRSLFSRLCWIPLVRVFYRFRWCPLSWGLIILVQKHTPTYHYLPSTLLFYCHHLYIHSIVFLFRNFIFLTAAAGSQALITFRQHLIPKAFKYQNIIQHPWG